jgi:hypothetical protein
MITAKFFFLQIITNVFVQLVILLYLLDNNAETSWMILMGQGMGMLIEAWKVTKAVDIQVVQSSPGSMLPYRLRFQGAYLTIYGNHCSNNKS